MNTNEEHYVKRPEPLLRSMSAEEMMDDLSLASLPESLASFCALLPTSPGTLSPRHFDSFVSGGSTSNFDSFVSAGSTSKSELLKESSTFSLCKDTSARSLDVNTAATRALWMKTARAKHKLPNLGKQRLLALKHVVVCMC